ncbi:lytic transglycosylase domain-containing protein [Burkholderia sp. MSMB1826]|uniref:lytic transglycosylase domain-containing protein n=1 Tax=Burkholderia sp. MSMB1826 TaxID=1637875 RepID=UPI0009E7EC11|nr:lytic transglycosylase domain-containing protein [Burkholderia sp. MSMB1826]
MMAHDLMALAQQCAPAVAPPTLAAIVRVESGFNPYAIGVVHGRLARQPRRQDEAIATLNALEATGWNYSAGLTQINRANWSRYGLTASNVFDVCQNLAAGATILSKCFARARVVYADPQQALRAALSCYESGDFITGFRTGYVQRVVTTANAIQAIVPAPTSEAKPIPVIPVRPVASQREIRPRFSPASSALQNPQDRTVRGQRDGESETDAVIF